MGIGLLDIAIEKLHRALPTQGQSQAGGDQGLPGASFTTGNGYNQLSSHHLRATLGAT